MWGDKVEERLKIIADRVLEGCLYARDEKGKLVLISMFLDPYTENELERKLSIDFKTALRVRRISCLFFTQCGGQNYFKYVPVHNNWERQTAQGRVIAT